MSTHISFLKDAAIAASSAELAKAAANTAVSLAKITETASKMTMESPTLEKAMEAALLSEAAAGMTLASMGTALIAAKQIAATSDEIAEEISAMGKWPEDADEAFKIVFAAMDAAQAATEMGDNATVFALDAAKQANAKVEQRISAERGTLEKGRAKLVREREALQG